MKLTFKRAILATTVAALITQTASAAPFTAGDILLGFRATGGVGAGNTYTLDLGSSLAFRDGTVNAGLLTNIGADLTAAFGANYATRSDIFFGIAGVRDSSLSGPAVSGDPRKTIYGSNNQLTLGVQSAAPTFVSSSEQSTTATDITSYQSAFQGATAGTNPNGAIILTSTPNNYGTYNDGTNSFESTFGENGIEASGPFASTALDLYRILFTTTGANPTGPVRTGVYEGSITVDGVGNVKFFNTADLASPAVPEPVSTGVLSTCAFLGLAAYGRRRQLARA